jgi:uncharacterized membrane protein
MILQCVYGICIEYILRKIHKNAKVNQQMVMDFWMTRVEPLFQNSLLNNHFLLDWCFYSNMYVKKLYNWVLVYLNFISSLFGT